MLIDRKTSVAVRCPLCGRGWINSIKPLSGPLGGGLTVGCMCGPGLFTP